MFSKRLDRDIRIGPVLSDVRGELIPMHFSSPADLSRTGVESREFWNRKSVHRLAFSKP
jgi:hypothetical protein